MQDLECQCQHQPTRAQRERAGRGGGANNGGGGGRSNSKPSPAICAPEWQITNIGATTKNPETGNLYRWCPHHTSKDGTVNGMYMPDGHDHTAWVVAKKAKFAAIKADKKDKAKRKVDHDNGQSPPASKSKKGPSKLALNKSMQKALITRFQISDKECGEIFNEAYNAAAAAATTADQSKE